MFIQNKMIIIQIFLLLFYYSSSSFGETKKGKKRPTIHSSEGIKLKYGFPSQNQDSAKIEKMRIIIKDSKTNHIAQIELEETAPDSSTFSGNFSVQWAEGKEITPEIYVPNQELLNEKDGLEKFLLDIENKKVKRKAFLIRKEDGISLIDIYDSKDQAVAALKAYQEKVEPPPITPPVIKTNPAAELFDTAQMAKELAEKNKVAKQAALQELERVRLEQLEKQKILDRQREQELLKAAEIAQKQNEAKKNAAKAIEHYKRGEYKEAQTLFEKSVELDPKNTTYYYQYGVTLYKNEEYNRSVVILRLAEGNNINLSEKKYYLALNLYQLKETQSALKYFQEVKTANDKILSPSAAFYEGKILFDEHHYELAKEAFEFVLDKSEDPRLDERAEKYIEQIAQIQYYLANKAKKFIFTLVFGENYDSNLLLLSDSSIQQDSASDEAGLQTQLQGGVEWRPLYDKQHEWSTKLNLAGTMTWNSSFQVVDSLRTADSTMGILSFPYAYKGTLWGKGYKLEVSPSFESIYMDPENGVSQRNIVNSTVASIVNTFIMAEKWFSIYNLELRQDSSLLSFTSSDDNASANKITLKTSQMFFFDNKRETGTIGDLSYALNQAKGKNNNYYRIEFGASYLSPIDWYKLSWISRIGYYNLKYPNKSTIRNDNNIAFTSSLSKKFNDWLAGALNLGYTNNSSNTNQYAKWNIGFSLIMNTAL